MLKDISPIESHWRKISFREDGCRRNRPPLTDGTFRLSKYEDQFFYNVQPWSFPIGVTLHFPVMRSCQCGGEGGMSLVHVNEMSWWVSSIFPLGTDVNGLCFFPDEADTP